MSVTTQEENKFVTFRLNREFYAIDVHKVQEVFVPSGNITSIPNAPNFVAGVINFRGSIVSVIDLKKRLAIKGKKQRIDDEEGRIYVIIVNTDDARVGLLVDYVESVISISNQNIQSTLDLISDASKTAFLDGVARTDLGLTIILKLDTILSEYDVSEIEKLAQIREKIASETEDDEVVVTDRELVDLDEDDISEYESASQAAGGFRSVSSGSDEIGTSPLDLNSLTKAELLKIAVEMDIDDVNTRSKKDEIVDAINDKMGNT